MDLESDPVVVRSVFPAEAVLPDGRVLRQALVKLTRAGVYVWHGERDLVLAEPHDLDSDQLGALPQGHALRAVPMRVPLADGALTVNKGAGCGCASPLKSFRPFGVERTATR